ncbi:MAG: hypothetical protein A3J05_00800 [Candidatus Doudnabacteria bacterium RIFCSPLOWO2_02_FULL_48_13]|uniref:Uncharacterized protein n=1 Tax=Candidatus Doudnabacteria bacterium RIFCSPLOWO2_02_FULL_48_13 TaxID=1817845 RepID=A0A1F5QC87_9BACT|nr:MAG: hypothetical protein A3J05_00800 [Candidatus Doudnabacteria bacterium RIFCSPLOWO2_02_FULL_48_13]OGF00875.1 MAG: hypothetical protein A3G07_02905 [Candidatus Doudnabacteria bacterium RIFCSPLOWO2_12_FULL_47_12]
MARLCQTLISTYSGRKEQGSEYSGYYDDIGFKPHQIIDYETRLPILQTVSPGARADVVWGKRLIRVSTQEMESPLLNS